MATAPNPATLRPTLSELAELLRSGKPAEVLSDVTSREVLAACRDRGIPVRDGRVELGGPSALADVYFGVRALRVGMG